MAYITYETLIGGQIEQYRDLCNELMAFQQAKATIATGYFKGVNFDSRRKKSFDHALGAQLIAVSTVIYTSGQVFLMQSSSGSKGTQKSTSFSSLFLMAMRKHVAST